VDARAAVKEYAGRALFVLSLRSLPAKVVLFHLRARRYARRSRDEFSLASSIRPGELNALLGLACGRRKVVELGTGTAWSAISLALDDTSRRVITYDPSVRAQREAYLGCAWPSVRERIEFRAEPDSNGPRAGEAVELLFVDSSHDRESVVRAFDAWRDALLPAAVVAFHDYEHPRYPGVREAIAELGLVGSTVGGLFVWRAPDGRS
jgi:predicted O-methyltransferase YrrM